MGIRALMLIAAVLTPAFAAWAEELDADTIARVNHARAKALKEVDAAFGNRPLHQLDAAERRAQAEQKQAAGRKVLEENKVSDKQFTNATSRLSREQQAQVKQSQEKLVAQDKQKAAKPQAPAAGEVPVQRGFSDDAPVTLQEGAAPAPQPAP
jgi:exonuclease VII large subunit